MTAEERERRKLLAKHPHAKIAPLIAGIRRADQVAAIAGRDGLGNAVDFDITTATLVFLPIRMRLPLMISARGGAKRYRGRGEVYICSLYASIQKIISCCFNGRQVTRHLDRYGDVMGGMLHTQRSRATIESL